MGGIESAALVADGRYLTLISGRAGERATAVAFEVQAGFRQWEPAWQVPLPWGPFLAHSKTPAVPTASVLAGTDATVYLISGDARLIVRGGSAGGFTTLAALAFRDVFAAGASYYGIGDLEAMARDTHKFESRYLDSLVGPYPEAIEVYRERSAIHHVDRLSSPMILFQGLDDKVVPPDQSVTMAAAVRARGLPVALLTFAGEGHGFRMAETITRTLEAELSFYGQVFGFEPAGDIPILQIDNLPSG